MGFTSYSALAVTEVLLSVAFPFKSAVGGTSATVQPPEVARILQTSMKITGTSKIYWGGATEEKLLY